MNKKITWIPSIFIISGGLYSIYYFNKIFNELKQMHEETSSILIRGLSSITLALSGSLLVPIFFAGIIIIVGIITIWKRQVVLAVLSLFLAIMMLNWVGSTLAGVGSILGFMMWKKKNNQNNNRVSPSSV